MHTCSLDFDRVGGRGVVRDSLRTWTYGIMSRLVVPLLDLWWLSLRSGLHAWTGLRTIADGLNPDVVAAAPNVFVEAWTSTSGLLVSRSADGGTTWSSPA